LYEKEGKKKEAARICAMALAAPGKDDETDTRRLAAAETRLGVSEESYTLGAKEYRRPPVSGAEALSEIRTTKPAGNANLDQKNATFALVFENGKKEVDVSFVSGAAELKDVGKGLATAKYQVSFRTSGRRGCFAWSCWVARDTQKSALLCCFRWRVSQGFFENESILIRNVSTLDRKSLGIRRKSM
jgi:hypothetical protein